MKPFAPLLALSALTLSACEEPADPPMPLPRESARAELREPPPLDDAGADPAAPDAPLEPHLADAETLGQDRLVSIATETSVYEEPRWGSHRLGYLRAGASVRRASFAAALSPRCPEGWYRVEPRGYVCIGSMASLDVEHPVAVASSRRPRLDDLPYPYVMSRSPPPPLYGRLPDRNDQLRFEPDLADHLGRVAAVPFGFPPPDAVPAWLIPGSPSLSLGNRWHAPDRVLLDHARPRSGFALLATIDHAGRRFGVTTGLEVLPIDRTNVVSPSTFSGIELDDQTTLPVAFVRGHGAYRIVDTPRGLTPAGALAYREAVAVSSEVRSVNGLDHLVLKDGTMVNAGQCVVAKPFKHPPAWAAEGVKWIDVSIPRQTLVAYEGLKPVYATLVSTGVGGTGDPRETHATVQGAFKIYEKHITVTMDGREAADPFDLRDVPFVQYFNEGYALHAAYWHDDFGRVHSHGCVNLAPKDAAWLFRWTDPRVPEGWHAVVTRGGGTIVYVHD